MSEMFEVVGETTVTVTEHPAETSTGHDYNAAVAQATYYVTSGFFPPLPPEYGLLAVQAVDACNEGDPYREFDVSALSIQPAGTDEDGHVTAARLVDVLRLDHMVEDPDDV